jgi:hypothetical protein
MFVVDEGDTAAAAQIEGQGMRALTAPILIAEPERRKALARDLIQLADVADG